MGGAESVENSNIQVVIGTKDMETIKIKQREHGGWNANMNECLTGPCQLVQSLGSCAIVKGPSGNVYRLNSELLIQYDTRQDHKIGSFVTLIENAEEFKRLQVQNGEWSDDMGNILGKKVEIIQQFQDGNVKIKYRGRTFRINSKAILTDNCKKTSMEMEETFEEGEKVMLIRNSEVMKNLQKDHGGWCELMNLFIGEEVEIVKILKDGDMYVSRLGMEWMINPKCIGKRNENKFKSEKLRKGDIVQICDDIQKIKQLQQNHGGWVNSMEFCSGKICKVQSILPSGDVKVNVDRLELVYNPLLLTKCEGNQANPTAARGQRRRSSALEKLEVKVFSPGDKVRLINNKHKIKRLQKGHGEWVNAMQFVLGKVGKVKSVDVNGDLKVKIMGQKLNLNPECVEATDSDCESEPDIQTMVNQLTQIIGQSDHSDESDEPDNDRTKTFFNALKIGNLNEVRKLVDSVGTSTLLEGVYPLMIAVNGGHIDVVKLLIEKRANLNAKEENGDTALHLAVQKDKFKICDLLINKGADVNAQNNNKITPIMLAASAGSMDITRLLATSRNADLSIGNSENDTALHLAVKNFHAESVNVLLDAGADIRAVNNKNFNAFHLVAQRGNERILEMFLKREGVKIVNSQKDDKFAALHLAVFNNHEGCLRVLLKYKADINIRNNNLQTALHIAVSQKYLNCMKILVEKGAEIDVTDANGDTPLHIAVRIHSMDTVKKRGKLLGISGIFQSTASSNEGSDKPEDLAIYLLKKKARTDIKNKNDKTPMDFCDPSLKEKLSVANARRMSKEIETKILQAQGPTTVAAGGLMSHPGDHIDRNSAQHLKTKDEELEELRQRIQDMEDERTCIICFDRQNNVTFGCGHVACDVCANNLYECHICRENIGNKIRLYR